VQIVLGDSQQHMISTAFYSRTFLVFLHLNSHKVYQLFQAEQDRLQYEFPLITSSSDHNAGLWVLQKGDSQIFIVYPTQDNNQIFCFLGK